MENHLLINVCYDDSCQKIFLATAGGEFEEFYVPGAKVEDVQGWLEKWFSKETAFQLAKEAKEEYQYQM